MPIRDTPSSRSSAFRLRNVLTSRVAGVALTVADVTAIASAVPLFRWHDGTQTSLDQAVRFSVAAPVDAMATVAIARDGRQIDSAVAPTGPDADPVLLFVPEVDDATTFTVTLTTGEGTASAELTVAPQRKMDISVVQHSHLDIGYTDPQAVVLDAQLAYLDQAVALVQATVDWPDEAKFRWVVEVTLPLRQWLAVRPRALREAFLAAVRSGQIEDQRPRDEHAHRGLLDRRAGPAAGLRRRPPDRARRRDRRRHPERRAGGDGRPRLAAQRRRRALPLRCPQLRRPFRSAPRWRAGARPAVLVAGAGRRPGAGLVHRFPARQLRRGQPDRLRPGHRHGAGQPSGVPRLAHPEPVPDRTVPRGRSRHRPNAAARRRLRLPQLDRYPSALRGHPDALRPRPAPPARPGCPFGQRPSQPDPGDDRPRVERDLGLAAPPDGDQP